MWWQYCPWIWLCIIAPGSARLNYIILLPILFCSFSGLLWQLPVFLRQFWKRRSPTPTNSPSYPTIYINRHVMMMAHFTVLHSWWGYIICKQYLLQNNCSLYWSGFILYILLSTLMNGHLKLEFKPITTNGYPSYPIIVTCRSWYLLTLSVRISIYDF